MELDNIRTEIDAIDKQLLSLFEQRMDCAKRVAQYKEKHSLPVLNVQRERQVLDRIEENAKSYPFLSRLLFSTIMNLSKMQQYATVTKNSALRRAVLDSKRDQSIEIKTIGCQGTIGSYSQAAASSAYPNAEIRFYDSFEQVFLACKNGEIEAGLLPAENSFAGVVPESYDLICKHELHISKVICLPVSHCIASTSDDISSIKTVCSHEQALMQCDEYIKAHGFSQKPMQNTAFAAEYAAKKGDDTLAAISSEQAAREYGLNILERNIQDSNDNRTRFILVTRQMHIEQRSDKTSIAFSLPHCSGSLFEALSKLAAGGVNMTRIQSRPDKATPFEYIFYIELDGRADDEAILPLLCGLESELPYFRLLGSYSVKE